MLSFRILPPLRLSGCCCFFFFLIVSLLLFGALDSNANAEGGAKKEDKDTTKCDEETLKFTVAGCSELLGSPSKPQSVPSRQYWTEVRDAYVKVVGDSGHRNTLTLWPQKRPKQKQLTGDNSDESTEQPFSGLALNVSTVKTDSKTGRGVFATRVIPAGTVVYRAYYHAVFPTECAFKTFLRKISWEQACDMLQWCYNYEDYDDDDDDESEDDEEEWKEDDESKKIMGVACCLDEGSLFNHRPRGTETIGYANPMDMDIVAFRDIKEGEELTQDYNSFEVGELDWFMDLFHSAWGDDAWDNYNQEEHVEADEL